MTSLSTCRRQVPHWYPCAGNLLFTQRGASSVQSGGVTVKSVLDLTGTNPDPTTTFAALSLVIWTLMAVTTIKYVSLVMRVDKDGESGILAFSG